MDETTEALAPTDAEIDAAWNDTAVEATEDSGDGEQEPAKPEADQPKVEEPVKEEPTTDKAKEEKSAEADQPLTFTLKHLDEVKTVDKDEIVKLAQQGMDYERIRTERDQLRDYRKEADPAMTFLKSYADKQGMSVSQYLDFCRKQELLSSGLDEKNATATLEIEKREATDKAAAEAKTAEEKQKQAAALETKQKADARQSDMSRFLKKFPDVKPDTIPPEVWKEVAKGDSIVTAYTEWRNQKLEAELAAERQNKANAQKTTGSLSTTGTGTQDEYDKWWNDD